MQVEGFDTGIWVDKEGFVCGGPTENIAIVTSDDVIVARFLCLCHFGCRIGILDYLIIGGLAHVTLPNRAFASE